MKNRYSNIINKTAPYAMMNLQASSLSLAFDYTFAEWFIKMSEEDLNRKSSNNDYVKEFNNALNNINFL